MAGTRGSQSTRPQNHANSVGVLRLEVGPQTVVIVRGELPTVNSPLTPAEVEVARAVQAGLSTREVAAMRGSSIRTLEKSAPPEG